MTCKSCGTEYEGGANDIAYTGLAKFSETYGYIPCPKCGHTNNSAWLPPHIRDQVHDRLNREALKKSIIKYLIYALLIIALVLILASVILPGSK